MVKKYNFISSTVLCISLTAVILFIGLVIFFLVQYLYPGSALRYKLCRKGSLDGTSSFTYIPFCRKVIFKEYISKRGAKRRRRA